MDSSIGFDIFKKRRDDLTENDFFDVKGIVMTRKLSMTIDKMMIETYELLMIKEREVLWFF